MVEPWAQRRAILQAVAIAPGAKQSFLHRDPSNFKHIGDGHTVADQINEVLEPYDLACIEASNDRIGGWQLMYQMLQTGEWQIADTCPRLSEANPTRIHDEKRLGDVEGAGVIRSTT